MKKIIILTLFIFIYGGVSFSQVVNIPLRITDGSSTGIDTLRFGLDPTATDCIDPALGEAQLPPAPPTGVFDARFVGTNLTPPLTCLGQGIKKDYRPGTSTYIGTKIHQLKYQVGTGTTITVNWSLPVGVTGRIYDIITGTLLTDTMYGTGSFVITNPSVFNSMFVRINYNLLTAPAAPTLLLPANGATGVSLTPLLDWNDVSGATTYRLQLSTNSGFTSTIINDSTLTSSQYTVSSGLLTNNTMYYWRVNAKNAGGTGPYSTAFNFTTLLPNPPSAPTLLLPANGATGVSLTPLLDWNDVSGATSYRLQLSTNSGFTTMIINDSTLTSSQYTVASGLLVSNTMYYWRVNAKNAGGSGSYSTVFNFTTLIPIPGAPALLLPANGATGVSLTPLLDWNDVTGATSYRLQVSANSGFTTTIINDSTLTSSQYTVASGLLTNNTMYYWRVNAKNAGGTGPYSTTFNFTTLLPNPPSAPTLLLPANGATGIILTPLLDWNDVSGATTYRLQLSTNSGFTSTIINDSTLTSSQYTVASGLLTNNTMYYWRVNAKNVGGTSTYSTVFNFTTLLPNPPSAPTLLLPANGATGVSLTPLLDWNDVSGATTYRLQLSTNSGFTTTIINDSTLASSQYTVASGLLTNNIIYYWRVNAKNAGGTSPYSTVFNFTTLISIPGAPTLLLPANGSTSISLTPLLDWNNVTYATSYRIQISTDSLFGTTLWDTSSVTPSQVTVPPGKLTGLTKYYWRVNASNIGGTGPWSAVWNFRTLQNLSINLKVYLEGFWDGSSQVVDTVKIYLANSTSPFAFADSATVILSSMGTANPTFTKTANGSYYIVVMHRNHLETWSKLPQAFITGIPVSYDFTTAANKAYGDNMKLTFGAWVLYAGDANQDGAVDALDVGIFITQFGNLGYLSCDFNGDGSVDALDVMIFIGDFGVTKAMPTLDNIPFERRTKEQIMDEIRIKYQTQIFKQTYSY